ncbi:MAG: peptide-methionine (R)-S-oxide reductase, partial [Solirubrobacterales bacterium]
MEKLEKTEQQWREELTPEQYEITRDAGTERPFTGKYVDTKADGSYACVCCGQTLFSSD